MINITQEQDVIELDQDFPFCIREIPLYASDNVKNPFHWHTYFEITYIRSGKGRYYANGKIYEVQAGDTMIFNSAEPHGWQILDREMDVIVINFETSFISVYSESEQLDFLRSFVEHGSNFQNKIDSNGIISKKIHTIMKELLVEWSNEEMGYRTIIHSDILYLLTLLTRYYQGKPKSEELLIQKQKAMDRLGAALIYINENCCSKITLKEAADTVFMSPNYFSHFFHKTTDTSFSDYVSLQRILRANEMMDNTNKSIQTIAIECGFNNLSNFYRLYKKHTGASPGKRPTR
ncbi:MAG: AraC family transcriptional regulator [Eubacteriales bacterium]|nr:AraC family transcriptional regulator [Eubacteriales bacterium]